MEGVELIRQYYPIPDVTWEDVIEKIDEDVLDGQWGYSNDCLLYTSPSPRDS